MSLGCYASQYSLLLFVIIAIIQMQGQYILSYVRCFTNYAYVIGVRVLFCLEHCSLLKVDLILVCLYIEREMVDL